VTKPFLFEGTRRMRSADAGIEELQKHVDTLIVIPNQNLFLVAKAETTFKEAFELADEVLQQGVRSITDLMVMPGLINLDFADVRSVMAEMGKAMMGTGEGSGEHRALEAAERAIANPLLDGVSMQGAKGVIISIIGGDDMKLLEVDEAANHIRELVDPNANIIWGSAFNPDLQGKIRVSVVATGIEQTPQMAEEASRPFSLNATRGPARPSIAVPGGQPIVPPAGPTLTVPPAPQVNFAPASFSPAPEPQPVFTPLSAPQVEEPLELGMGQEASGNPDELLLDASSLADFDGPSPARRQNLLSSQEPQAQQPYAPQHGSQPYAPLEPTQRFTPAPEQSVRPAGTSGGTLFERMANLAGRRHGDDDDHDGDEGGAINIPRFLGRQNNQ